MKKNDVFTFTAPNGVEVTGVVVAIIGGHEDNWATYTHYLCYAQIPYKDCAKMQLIKYVERAIMTEEGVETSCASCTLLVELAYLPEYDDMLEEYQRNAAMENASTLQPWEEEFEREIQGCNDK